MYFSEKLCQHVNKQRSDGCKGHLNFCFSDIPAHSKIMEDVTLKLNILTQEQSVFMAVLLDLDWLKTPWRRSQEEEEELSFYRL